MHSCTPKPSHCAILTASAIRRAPLFVTCSPLPQISPYILSLLPAPLVLSSRSGPSISFAVCPSLLLNISLILISKMAVFVRGPPAESKPQDIPLCQVCEDVNLGWNSMIKSAISNTSSFTVLIRRVGGGVEA